MGTVEDAGVRVIQKRVIRKAETGALTLDVTVNAKGSGEIRIHAWSGPRGGRLNEEIVTERVLEALLEPSLEAHLVAFLGGDPRRAVIKLLTEVHRELEEMLEPPHASRTTPPSA